MTIRRLALGAVILAASLSAQSRPYAPTWASVDARPTPAWYDQAKFGIFIHWGVYSVPAFADPKASGGEAYSEWYWKHLEDKSGPTARFHERVFGAKVRYQDFAPQFKAELFDPAQWADVLARSGAKYVVLTSKHHDGFALWPSAQSWNWNSMDVGPHRDLAGDLSAAVKARGLKMGFYYSLYEWYNPLYHSDPAAYVAEHMLPQLKDLVTRYHPAVLWTDGEWEQPSSVWRSPEFLAWLFNDSPVKDEVAVNDRWGKETRSVHGGFYTTEYGKYNNPAVGMGAQHKWEECRGMGKSFGYNRMETPEDYKSAHDLIWLLLDTVSRGGNLLLDIGPTADGRIPVIMQQRLLDMGGWLGRNGEAVYQTRPWRVAADGPHVDYTTREGAVYAMVDGWPGRTLVLTAPKSSPQTTVRLLGTTADLAWHQAPTGLQVELPPAPDDASPVHVYTFKLSGVE